MSAGLTIDLDHGYLTKCSAGSSHELRARTERCADWAGANGQPEEQPHAVHIHMVRFPFRFITLRLHLTGTR